jgi:uncharacterized protein (DUF4213/DUF364 family)
MSHIETFLFNKENFDKIRDFRFGKNWPVVYVLENGKASITIPGPPP